MWRGRLWDDKLAWKIYNDSRKDNTSRKDILRFLEIVGKHAKRLEAIIEDLLSLSKIEKDAETEGILLSDGRILDVLKTAIQICETKANVKDITIERLNSFLKKHQAKREKARSNVDRFLKN